MIPNMTDTSTIHFFIGFSGCAGSEVAGFIVGLGFAGTYYPSESDLRHLATGLRNRGAL